MAATQPTLFEAAGELTAGSRRAGDLPVTVDESFTAATRISLSLGC